MVDFKVADLELEGKGLFHYINLAKPLPFLEVDEISYLDTMFRGLYGERSISPLVSFINKDGLSEQSMILLGKMINTKYYHKWVSTHKLISEEILLDDLNLLETETVLDTEINADTVSDETTRLNTDKVTGYNSDIMVDDTTKENNDIKLINTNRNKDKTKSKEKLSVGKSKSSLYTRISGVGFLRYNILLDTIYSDIVNEVGLLIY